MSNGDRIYLYADNGPRGLSEEPTAVALTGCDIENVKIAGEVTSHKIAVEVLDLHLNSSACGQAFSRPSERLIRCRSFKNFAHHPLACLQASNKQSVP